MMLSAPEEIGGAPPDVASRRQGRERLGVCRLFAISGQLTRINARVSQRTSQVLQGYYTPDV